MFIEDSLWTTVFF